MSRSSTQLARPGRGAVWALLALILSACSSARAQTTPPRPDTTPEEAGTIRVTGQARVFVPADQVQISFAVESEAETAAAAAEANARAMSAVLDAVRGLGRDDLTLETYGYSLHPDYARPSGDQPRSRTISGYRAVNRVRVTVPDVQAAGPILDAATGAGANRVESLQFQATDTRAARLQALREAVETAREEAGAMAEAMGVRLGRPLEVQGGASAPPPRPVPGGARVFEAAAAAPTPVESESQVVSASVTITYGIAEVGR